MRNPNVEHFEEYFLDIEAVPQSVGEFLGKAAIGESAELDLIPVRFGTFIKQRVHDGLAAPMEHYMFGRPHPDIPRSWTLIKPDELTVVYEASRETDISFSTDSRSLAYGGSKITRELRGKSGLFSARGNIHVPGHPEFVAKIEKGASFDANLSLVQEASRRTNKSTRFAQRVLLVRKSVKIDEN